MKTDHHAPDLFNVNRGRSTRVRNLLPRLIAVCSRVVSCTYLINVNVESRLSGDKKPVGDRLAQTAAVVAYGKTGHSNGPTISGCSMSGNKITITFNKTLLAEGGADTVKVQPYYAGNVTIGKKLYGDVGSKMEVLTNASGFCLQQGKGALGCGTAAALDVGVGVGSAGHPPPPPNYWTFVDISAGAAPNEIVVDLTRANGTVSAIRYGWTGDCCSEHPPTSDPCPVGICPLMGSMSGLPANPFIAHIVDGKCKCVAPQVCDE